MDEKSSIIILKSQTLAPERCRCSATNTITHPPVAMPAAVDAANILKVLDVTLWPNKRAWKHKRKT